MGRIHVFEGKSQMDAVTLLGLVAAALTTTAFLPQLLKTWRSKSAKDVSLWMLITFSIGVFLWLIYGVYIQSLPVIIANSVTFVLSSINLILKIRYES
ncbi:SemiSWEET transporter [Trichocoleus sp. FACHB-262]|uniref:SemiSWEET transporter n=1 Tax=Trichocoleus sp. FACHB-262 TaxID=2692869 RepID=UPI001F55602D|nr:SemiSWEET transporter [Trichocoleus sp. FACHB-262]